MGRFLSADAASQFASPYVGMGNVPVMGVDPDGELAWLAAVLFGVKGAFDFANAQNNGLNNGQSLLYAGLNLALTAGIGDVPGAIPNALLHAGVGVASNGISNTALGQPFFNNWQGSAIAGGVSGGIRGYSAVNNKGTFNPWTGGRRSNFWNGTDSRSLAYTYAVDTRTGSITRISDLGGRNTHFYYYGEWIDEGTAFISNGSLPTIVERVNSINAFRFWQSASSTISAFNIPATGESGFFLEPAGPSTTVRNQDQRIPAGTYNLEWYKRPSNGAITARIYNDQVPRNRYILEHTGNLPEDTAGCLIPGCGWAPNRIVGGQSREAHLILHRYFIRSGIWNVNLNIFNAFD